MQIFVYFSFKRKGPLTAISSAPPCTLRIKFKFLCKFKIYKEGTQINDIKSSTRIITPPSMYYQQCYHKYVLSKVVLSSQVCIIQGSIIITSMYYPRQYYYHKYVLSKVVLLSQVCIIQGSIIIISMYYPKQYYYHMYIFSKVVLLPKDSLAITFFVKMTLFLIYIN